MASFFNFKMELEHVNSLTKHGNFLGIVVQILCKREHLQSQE